MVEVLREPTEKATTSVLSPTPMQHESQIRPTYESMANLESIYGDGLVIVLYLQVRSTNTREGSRDLFRIHLRRQLVGHPCPLKNTISRYFWTKDALCMLSCAAHEQQCLAACSNLRRAVRYKHSACVSNCMHTRSLSRFQRLLFAIYNCRSRRC